MNLSCFVARTYETRNEYVVHENVGQGNLREGTRKIRKVLYRLKLTWNSIIKGRAFMNTVVNFRVT